MKKQINALRLLTLAGFLTLTLFGNANNAQSEIEANQIEAMEYFNSFNYSWASEAEAVSYTLEIVNLATQQSYSWETTDTSVSIFSIPNGTYDLTVTANFSNNSYSIIIADIVDH